MDEKNIQAYPLGRWIFYRLIIAVNPYSKSIGSSLDPPGAAQHWT